MASLFWYAFYEDFSVLPCSSWWDLQLNNFHPLNVPPHGFFLCASKMKYKQKLSKTRKCSQEVFIEIVSLRTNKSRSLNDMCYILSTSVYMYFYFIIGLAQQKQWPGTLKVMSNWKIYSFTHHFQWCLINTHARGKDNVFLAFFYKVLMSRYNQEVNLRNYCVKFEFGTAKHQNFQDYWVTKTSRTLSSDFRTSLFVVWLS